MDRLPSIPSIFPDSRLQLMWDPKEHGGIETIRVPPDKIWLPDMVLFNKYALPIDRDSSIPVLMATILSLFCRM